LDFSLASKLRQGISTIRVIDSNDTSARVGREVFDDLTKTQMISSFGLPYHWTFTILRTSDVNAISLPDGEVAAYGGLAKLIGNNRGLWAAVLSHEISHLARRHSVRKALYHLYLQQQIDYYKRGPS
jgi:predicted Zn-dependent protease